MRQSSIANMPGEHANSIGSDMHVRCSGNCNRIVASGEMGDRVRNHDWTNTALGPIHSWSETLVVSTNLMLSCQFPSVMLWGAEMIQIYNDAYLPLMAEKHPSALGQRAQECWAEAWHIIGPQFEAAFHGIPTHKENMLVPVIRHGKLQEVYWTYSYSPIYGRDGKISGILIVCHDVNAEVAALRDLHANEMLAAQVSRDNEAKLKLATTAAELGIWVWYLQEDRGTWENDRMYGIFGRTRADGPLSHAQFVAQSLHPLEGMSYLQKIESAIQTGEPFVFEGRFYPSGRLPGWVEFQGQLEYGPDGAPWRILGTARDITARKHAEIALQASEERLRLAQTAGKLATWEWDLNTNEFVWSGEVAKIYGLPAEELTHLDRLTSYLHPEDRDKAMQAVYRAAKKGVEFKHEFRVIRPDGVIRWVAGRGTRVHLSEGRAALVVGINWDITEEKLVEDALHSERKRMEELFRQAPAFIAVVRGPQHVFEIGRIVNGNIHVELRKRAIRPITCFEGEIRQVLGNLVSNAIDAMQPTGGRLICRSRGGTNWRTGKKGLILTIADTGPGMSPLVLKRIFEPFFRQKGSVEVGSVSGSVARSLIVTRAS